MLSRLLSVFRPSRTVPITSWTATSRWSLNPIRVTILIVGLGLFGFGDALLVQSTLGNSPWTVLAQGITIRTHLPIGWVTFGISILVLAGWIPLKSRPGFGTVANIVVIALFLQIGTEIIPLERHTLWIRLLYVLGGIAIIGIGSALYITCGLGPGPRDGLMTGIHLVTGVRVGRVRLMIEILAMSSGWLLGGRIGVGTLLFALLIGNSVAISLGLVQKLPAAEPAQSKSSNPEIAEPE